MARLSLKKKNAKPCDFLMLVLTVILVIFGIGMVFSASYYKALNSPSGSPFTYLEKQGVFAMIGAVIMYVCSYLDYHLWQRYSLVILAIAVALLVLVLLIGTNVNGAKRWIYIGPISIMPGEIAKFAMICFMSAYFSGSPDRAKLKGLIIPVILTLGVAGLIILQPNLSTAITVCGIVFGMAFIAGLHWGYIVGLLGAGAAAFVVLANSGTYWAARITSFQNPFKDSSGDGWQAVQSLLALGTGGLSGLGIGKSIQKNLYLPEPQNDFILAIIGEELGLIGILVLLLVFALLIWRCLRTAIKAPDRFGMLMASGVGVMIGLQVILNVAVVTSSMPPTGVALPFISYGGNSLWIFMGSVGILLNISRQIDEAPKEDPAKRRLRMRREARQAARARRTEYL